MSFFKTTVSTGLEGSSSSVGTSHASVLRGQLGTHVSARTFSSVSLATQLFTPSSPAKIHFTGLKFPINTPIYVYPLGLIGFVIVTQGIATLLLRYYHPGGVKHALSPESSTASNSAPLDEKPCVGSTNGSQKLKDRVDVAVEGLQLTVRRRGFFKRGPPVSKVILAQVDAFFPAGEVRPKSG